MYSYYLKLKCFKIVMFELFEDLMYFLRKVIVLLGKFKGIRF